MSFPRDILNSLLEKVAADDTPLSHVDEQLLEQELQDRTKARRSKVIAPGDNPLARASGASAEAKKTREDNAEKRHRSIAALRKRRLRAQQPPKTPPRTPPRGSSKRRGPQPRRGVGGKKDAQIAAHYKTLNLPYGADFEAVKKSYRTLMRKYHPDLHRASEKKQKAANELSIRVTQAYNELEQHLSPKTS